MSENMTGNKLQVVYGIITDEAIADEDRKVQRAEREKRRIAALPDAKKLSDYVGHLQAVADPHLSSPDGALVLGQIGRKLNEAAKLVSSFADSLGD